MTIAPSPQQIGEVIQNALVFNFKNTNPAMTTDFLIESVRNLFNLLQARRIPYVLVGGIALLTYVEGRNTQDIDLILSPDALPKLPEIKISDQNKDFARGSYNSLQIDLLFTDNPLFEKIYRAHTAQRQFREQSITTATVQGLLLLKLYALPSLYRQGSFARVALYENDIAVLLHDYPVDLPALYAELLPFLNASDFDEIKNIVAEIQQRIARYQNKNSNPT